MHFLLTTTSKVLIYFFIYKKYLVNLIYLNNKKCHLPIAVTLTRCDPITVSSGKVTLTLVLNSGVFFKSISTGLLYSWAVPSGCAREK